MHLSCCQFGCTVPTVSKHLQRADSEARRAQRRWREAVLFRSLCQHAVSCGLGELLQPRSNGVTRSSGLPSASYPVLCSGSRFGAYPAPCGTASFCFGYAAPSGSRFLPKEVCKPRQRTPHKLLSGPSKKALLGTWEPGPLARFREG